MASPGSTGSGSVAAGCSTAAGRALAAGTGTGTGAGAGTALATARPAVSGAGRTTARTSPPEASNSISTEPAGDG